MSPIKLSTAKLGFMAFVISCALGIVATGLMSQGSGTSQQPQPYGAAPETWQDANGQPILGLIPERAGVSTLDGGVLLHATGEPVTIPFGAEARGEISPSEADRQTRAALELQRLDACRRGLDIPLGAGYQGPAASAKDAANRALAALEAARQGGGAGKGEEAPCGR